MVGQQKAEILRIDRFPNLGIFQAISESDFVAHHLKLELGRKDFKTIDHKFDVVDMK